MTTDLSNEIFKRFQQAVNRKVNWKETYQEGQEYGDPWRENFDEREEGTRRDNADRVFDSTAQVAGEKFVSNLQSSLVPPMKKWINLAPGMLIPEDQRDEKAQQLGKIREILFNVIHNSNFDIQVAESFHNLKLGTGAMLVQKGTKDRPVNHISVPLDQLYLEGGPNGRVETVFRKHNVAARHIKSTWEDAKLDVDLEQAIKDSPEKPLPFIEATIPAKVKRNVVNKKTNRREAITVDGFKYIVMAEKTKNIIVERDQESSPWIIFRWSVRSGEPYGIGPVLFALADIKTVNKTKELILKNASLAVAGAWTVVDDGVISLQNIEIAPGAKIPVTNNPGSIAGPTISPLQSGADFNVAQLILKDLQQNINNTLFADPLGPIDLPVKTATEIAVRQQELSKRIGSAFGRLQFEFIAPYIDRVLFLLEEQGLIDLSGFRVDGKFIAIEHISPLAMAQDQEELTSIIRYAETLAGIFGPQAVLMLLKPDEFARKTSELLNVPKDLVPSKLEFEKLKEQIQQFAAQQQAAVQQGQQELK